MLLIPILVTLLVVLTLVALFIGAAMPAAEAEDWGPDHEQR